MTTCVSPPELDDSQLLSYLEDKTDDAIASHLRRCPHCQTRADRLERFQSRLTAHLYRIDCPPPAELADRHLGLLDASRSQAIDRHVHQCPHCTREAAQLKTYLAELAPDIRFNAVERVKVLIARLAGGLEQHGRDAFPLAPVPVGIRGDQEGPHVFQTDGAQIAIDVQDDAEQPGRRVLLGLVTGLEAPSLSVHLWQGQQRLATSTVDEAGNFTLAGLAPGHYELIVSGPEVEIHIQDLTV